MCGAASSAAAAAAAAAAADAAEASAAAAAVAAATAALPSGLTLPRLDEPALREPRAYVDVRARVAARGGRSLWAQSPKLLSKNLRLLHGRELQVTSLGSRSSLVLTYGVIVVVARPPRWTAAESHRAAEHPVCSSASRAARCARAAS